MQEAYWQDAGSTDNPQKHRENDGTLGGCIGSWGNVLTCNSAVSLSIEPSTLPENPFSSFCIGLAWLEPGVPPTPFTFLLFFRPPPPPRDPLTLIIHSGVNCHQICPRNYRNLSDIANKWILDFRKVSVLNFIKHWTSIMDLGETVWGKMSVTTVGSFHVFI